ncbi:hypothetical protein CANCADRAFT_116274 [Tortispora caseinolytica NRRL Y-17796]|uniref:Protein kinase domain-containing protein n=1 Tax=Tortispora caseinolytica NRRL Y-17796 TaxID=767744 RepID=A0A1E4THA8_9ASCO|nr:hypothetical protein CANCADRAFT_116274 [Tortispora caseinolytica NRRL Y-17796]
MSRNSIFWTPPLSTPPPEPVTPSAIVQVSEPNTPSNASPMGLGISVAKNASPKRTVSASVKRSVSASINQAALDTLRQAADLGTPWDEIASPVPIGDLSNVLIPPNDVTVKADFSAKLGEGAYARIYAARVTTGSFPVPIAVKMGQSTDLLAEARVLSYIEILRQTSAGSRFSDLSVIRFFGLNSIIPGLILEQCSWNMSYYVDACRQAIIHENSIRVDLPAAPLTTSSAGSVFSIDNPATPPLPSRRYNSSHGTSSSADYTTSPRLSDMMNMTPIADDIRLKHELTSSTSGGPVVGAFHWTLWARKLLDALDFLKSSRIVHGDIKPSNILISADGLELKLCDFTSARIVPDDPANDNTPPDDGSHSSPALTIGFAAPELFVDSNEMATYSSDLFSLGLVLLYAATGRAVYDPSSTGPDDVVKFECSPVSPYNDMNLSQVSPGSNKYTYRRNQVQYRNAKQGRPLDLLTESDHKRVRFPAAPTLKMMLVDRVPVETLCRL